MAFNFDFSGMRRMRSVISGEVNGSVRFLALAFFALLVWLAVFWMDGRSRSLAANLKIQQNRYSNLSNLAAEYRLSVKEGADAPEADAMGAFTQVSGQLALGERVDRIAPSPDGKTLTVLISRLYAEELGEAIRALALRNILIRSAELKVFPSGKERLFSLNADLGPRE